jgi:hypothetical protein
MYTTYITTTINRSKPNMYHHISPDYIKTTTTAAQFGSCKVSTKKVTYHLMLLSWLDFDSAKGPMLPPT